MATIKIKFRPSSVSTKEGTLFYQVIHERVARQISAGCKLFPYEWDRQFSDIILPCGDDLRRACLTAVKVRLEKDTQRLEKIVAKLERQKETYTSDKIVQLYREWEDEDGFVSFTRKLISRLKQMGKVRTSETYTTALNSFLRFYGEDELPLDKMDSCLISGYEAHLALLGICPNSSSFYMRNLRAIYNRAVEEGITKQNFPFRHVYTGIDKTIKRALSLKTVRRIKEIDLTQSPDLDYARDMFFFSLYTRGMSFIDMAYLKKSNLTGGILSYRRKKTGQQLFIKWEKPMQELVDKYAMPASPYLLPILKLSGKDERLQYKNAAHFINGKLKQIGLQLGLAIPLTMYVARHTWASVAKSKHVPLSVISEAMGHDSENTTRIYLASLDTTVVDKANRLVLKSL